MANDSILVYEKIEFESNLVKRNISLLIIYNIYIYIKEKTQLFYTYLKSISNALQD